MRRYTIGTAQLTVAVRAITMTALVAALGPAATAAPAQPTSPQRGAPPAPASRAAQQAPGRPAAASTFDVMEASITDLQQAMASGRVTSARLVDAYMARIAAFDHRGPALNTMIRLNPRARADAAALDAERRNGRLRGPMHGIPIVLKDNYDTRDIPTTGGSIALVNHQPARDAFVVQKLREAGAVILGKTNLHELAAGITSISSLGGQTLNAYNPDRCPGGSSGGTSSAVAANFAAIGWGTDTCGSIRIPAAFASLVGLRPTQGLYSRDGIIPLSLTQDTPGPLARTVRDLAIGLDVTAGADPNDPQTQLGAAAPPQRFQESLKTDALRGARIGIFRPYFRNVEGDIADTVRAAAMAMRALGAEVVEVNMPDFDDVIAGSRAIILETKFDLVDYFTRTGESPVRSLREIIDRGLFDRQLETRHKDADTATARGSAAHRAVLARQAQLRARMIAFLDSLKLDAIAYPTIGQRPVLVGSPQTASSCALASQSGLPAISLPAGFT
ncbi:MAG: amidase family protein, partial [Gemmatimonadota bacterium]|nr:amidase family protein [Gemmatimonadota bacterium]